MLNLCLNLISYIPISLAHCSIDSTVYCLLVWLDESWSFFQTEQLLNLFLKFVFISGAYSLLIVCLFVLCHIFVWDVSRLTFPRKHSSCLVWIQDVQFFYLFSFYAAKHFSVCVDIGINLLCLYYEWTVYIQSTDPKQNGEKNEA